MNKLIHRSKLFINRNASTILTCIGGVGVIATSVMTAKATPKALLLLDKAEEEKGEKLTKVEVIKVAGPAYVPTIITGVSTIACIFGANMLSKRQQAALMSAYALLDSSYKDYKKKVEELYGEDADGRINKEIVKDKYEDSDLEFEYEDDKHLFYDTFSRRYFEATKAAVQRAEYEVNRNLVMRDYCYLNEFYEEIGIDPIESGYKYGWSNGANMDRYWQSWVDFDHTFVELEDGLECCIITMSGEPILDFENYI